VSLQQEATPKTDGTYDIDYKVTVKHIPKQEEFEMYNVTDDPMELSNLYGDGVHSAVQATLAALLHQQCAKKRLVPCSGDVPGQPDCGQPGCT
jgi:choline-sulfatase